MNNEFDNMLFNYETTNRTDYRIIEYELPPCPPVRGKRRTITPTTNTRATPYALKDVYTLSDWKKDLVTFDLFMSYNEIIRKDPTQIQQVYTKPEDLKRELVQRTRPRLVMTPAVSVDDIESKETRQLLMDDVYLTESERARREGACHASGARKTRVLQLPAPANPITLVKYHPPYVSPEWRFESASWDGRQHRAKCDAHREYFLRRKSRIT